MVKKFGRKKKQIAQNFETYLNSLLGLRLAISGTGGVSSTMSKLESSSAPETFNNILNEVKAEQNSTQNNVSAGSERD